MQADCLRCRFYSAEHNDFQPCGTNREAAGLAIHCEGESGYMPIYISCENCGWYKGGHCGFYGEGVCLTHDGTTPTQWVPIGISEVLGETLKDTVDSVVSVLEEESKEKPLREPVPPMSESVSMVNIPDIPRQVDHYQFRGGIEPATFIASNDLSYLEGNIVKYVYRYPVKQGVKALEKARDYLDMLIERQRRIESINGPVM